MEDHGLTRIELVMIFVIGCVNKFIRMGILVSNDDEQLVLSEKGNIIYEQLNNDDNFSPTDEELHEVCDILGIDRHMFPSSN